MQNLTEALRENFGIESYKNNQAAPLRSGSVIGGGEGGK